MALAERSISKVAPSMLLGEMLGNPISLQAVMNPNDPLHSQMLLRFQARVSYFDLEQKTEVTHKLLDGIATQSPFWTDDRRIGALQLFKKLNLLKVTTTGTHLRQIVENLDPKNSTAKGNVTSVIQAIHLSAPVLTNRNFYTLMNKMVDFSQQFEDEDREYLESLLDRVKPPNQLIKLERLKTEFEDDTDKIMDHMFPDDSLSPLEYKIIWLNIGGMSRPNIARQLNLTESEVTKLFKDVGLSTSRLTKEEQMEQARILNEENAAKMSSAVAVGPYLRLVE